MTLSIMVECCYAVPFMLTVVYYPFMLNVIMPSVVMLIVVAPKGVGCGIPLSSNTWPIITYLCPFYECFFDIYG